MEKMMDKTFWIILDNEEVSSKAFAATMSSSTEKELLPL